MPDVSLPSLIAAIYYLAVASVCLTARFAEARPKRSRNPAAIWLLGGIVMTVLAGVRIYAGEDFLRGLLRSTLFDFGLLEGRAAIQGPLVILTAVASLALCAALWNRARNPDGASPRSPHFMASLSLIGLAALLALRLISLHTVDTLLYTPFIGAIRLNWILDIGLTTILAWSAIIQIKASGNMRD